MNCEAASAFCSTEIASPYVNAGLNWYDMSQRCENPENLCYSVISYTTVFIHTLLMRY